MKCLLPLLLASGALASTTLPFKHLSGPASEFPLHRTPSPDEARVGETSFLLAIQLGKDLAAAKAAHYSLSADADPTTGNFSFAVITPLFPTLSVSLADPEGSPVDLKSHLSTSSFPATISSTGAASQEIPAGVYTFKAGEFQRGTYRLTLSDPSGAYAAAVGAAKRSGAQGVEEGRIIVNNFSPVGIVSRLLSYSLKTNSEIGIEAWIGPRTTSPSDIASFVGTRKGGVSWTRAGGRVVARTNVTLAQVLLTLPNGTTDTIRMTDDGTALDKVAHDGVYTGTLKNADLSGTYLTRAEFIGTTEDGFAFSRSSQQLIPVVEDTIALTGRATIAHQSVTRLAATAGPHTAGIATAATVAPVSQPIAARHADPAHSFEAVNTPAGAETVRVYMGVEGAKAPKYSVYAELWGSDSTQFKSVIQLPRLNRALKDSQPKGAGWVGGYSLVSAVTSAAGAQSEAVELFVPGELFEQVAPPYSLQNVAVYDAGSGVLLASLPLIELPAITTRVSAAVRSFAARRVSNGLGTFENVAVSYGPVPLSLYQGVFGSRRSSIVIPSGLALTASAAQERAGTALSHGYCASENPFNRSSVRSAWTESPHFFLDTMASRTNDEFAQLAHGFFSTSLDSYGWIGHSQGGVVGTHLASFYWSGVDRFAYPELGSGRAARTVSTAVDASRRPVQSIGSPYKGSTAAGSAANLGKVFGVGCGSNTDMSLDGAKLWLARVPTAARAQVYYATTSYQQGTLFGDACSTPMNMILQWPNDGVSENVYTVLDGATNLGNTQKQCHTTDMNYAPQYDDVSRAQDFNKYV